MALYRIARSLVSVLSGPRARRRAWPAPGALGAVVVVLLLVPAAGEAATVNVSTTGDDGRCARDGIPCRTAARAVDIAEAGDIVQFEAGDFSISPPDQSGLQITKTLDLRGAQYGVDARGRSGPETVLTYTAPVATIGVIYVRIGAAGTSVRGFTIRQGFGDPSGVPGAGLHIEMGGADGGYTIAENIITDNTSGMFFGSSGAATSISRNVFSSNQRTPQVPAAGNGIYAERASNVAITDNEFTNNLQTGVIEGGVGSQPGGGQNLTVARNRSVSEDALTFSGITDLQVSANTFVGGGLRAITLAGDGLTNATVVHNTIVGKTGALANAIRLTNFRGEQNRAVTIRENTVTGTDSTDATNGNAIWITPDGAQGQLTVINNRLVGNSGAGVRNEDSDVQVDARRNWWGCNTGPGSTGCDTVTSPDAGTAPTVAPWLTLSLNAMAAATTRGVRAAQIPTGSSAVAGLANLSTGGLANGPFFGSAQAVFASTPEGSFAPPAAPLSAEALTASTQYTGAAAADELRVTVDNETVQIANLDPPAPDLIPDVEPSDPTLDAGQLVRAIVALTNSGNRTARRLRACLSVSEKLRLSGRRCRSFKQLPPGRTIAYQVAGRAVQSACRGPVNYQLRLTASGQRPRSDRARGRLRAGRCGNPPCPTVSRASQRAARRPDTSEVATGRAARQGTVRARAAC